MIASTRSRLYNLLSSQLVKAAGIYAIFTAADKAIPVLFLPIAIAKLEPASLGLIALFVAANLLFSTLAPLQTLGVLPTRFYKLGKDDFRVYLGNAVISICASEILFIIILLPLWPRLSSEFHLPSSWLMLLILSSLGSSLFENFQTLSRLADKKALFGCSQLSKSFFEIGLTLGLVFLVPNPDQLSRIIPITFVNGFFGFGSFAYLFYRGDIKLKPKKIYLKEIIYFCLPLIPHALGSWMINSSDRFFLARFQGMVVTGKYEVVYTLGMMTALISRSFNLAWSPYLFKILSQCDARQAAVRTKGIRHLYFVAITCIAVLLAGLSHLAVTYFAPAKYQVDGALIYLITAAYVAQAYYLMYTNYLFHFHKTIMLLFITGFSGLLGVFLNIWLIPSYGMVGAAIATLVSFASLFVLTKGAVSYLFRRAN